MRSPAIYWTRSLIKAMSLRRAASILWNILMFFRRPTSLSSVITLLHMGGLRSALAPRLVGAPRAALQLGSGRPRPDLSACSAKLKDEIGVSDQLVIRKQGNQRLARTVLLKARHQIASTVNDREERGHI